MRLLDVGCGRGDYLALMREAGWHTAGVEPSAAAVAVARERGLAVVHGTLPDAGYPDASFDVVTFADVLEHVPDPLETLVEAARVLKLGGQVLIFAPNVKSWECRLFGPHWFSLDAPRHLSHFAPATLAALLARAGLEVESVRFRSKAFVWCYSLGNALAGRGPGRAGDAARTTLARVVDLGLHHILLPLARLADATGHGGHLAVRAVKPRDANG